MTNESRFVQFLRMLTEKSAKGLAGWGETADEDCFRVALGQGVVKIERRHSIDGDIYFVATLLSRSGKDVEDVVYDPSNVRTIPNSFLLDLFSSARRNALKIDDLLSSMEADMKVEKTRSLPDEASDADDDMPF